MFLSGGRLYNSGTRLSRYCPKRQQDQVISLSVSLSLPPSLSLSLSLSFSLFEYQFFLEIYTATYQKYAIFHGKHDKFHMKSVPKSIPSLSLFECRFFLENYTVI